MSIGKLIEKLVSQVEQSPASVLVQRAIALEGCIPADDRLAPLASSERYVIERITGSQLEFSAKGHISLAFRPHGRLYVLPRNEFEANAEFLTLLGHVELAESDLHKYLALRESDQYSLEQDRAVILAYLHKYGFDNVCNELLALSDHMAPLIYYVGPHCFSNFYNIGKSDFGFETTLVEALQQVNELRDGAPTRSLLVVYCLHVLLLSGSYTRLEELNSTQLSRAALEGYLDAKTALYRDAGASQLDADDRAPIPTEDKARRVAQMKKTIESSTSARFARYINGVNLRKKEILLPIPPVRTVASEDFAELSTQGEAMLQGWVEKGRSAREMLQPENFAELVQQMAAPDGSLFSSRLEGLIDRVVSEAVLRTNSDFGMSRGVRDFLAFVQAIQRGDAETVCAWGQGDYFCHVAPGERMRASLAPRVLCMTINAISGRMRYNSWHYAPSYFGVENIPDGRGWFYAPRMADIADHSDMHHSGHVHAGVRYSIRSPLPICAGQTVFPGFIDLRLMRQQGDPYTESDLLLAITYTEYLQSIYQHLMNYLLKTEERFTFSFGSKEWIDRTYAPRDLGVSAA